jgi:hypothetical protein
MTEQAISPLRRRMIEDMTTSPCDWPAPHKTTRAFCSERRERSPRPSPHRNTAQFFWKRGELPHTMISQP